MKKTALFILFLSAILLMSVACGDKPEPPTPPAPSGKVPIVSQFVYDGMSAYYLWSNEMINKKPSVNNTDPKEYFKSVLYETDTDHGWSWITDDASSLVGGFAGKQFSFGYNLTYMFANKEKTQFYAIVKYVYKNSPAEKAGIKRLDLIGKLDGSPITGRVTEEGYIKFDNNKLFGNNPVTFSLFKFSDNGIVPERDITVTPTNIDTDPVLFDKIFTVGDKKIGYLFYTNYIANFNYRLHEVFSKFKQEGVTDLVLDLRYNPGGGVNAASYLVSLFAPETAVKEKSVLVKLNYNQFLNKYFDEKGRSRSTKLGTYQEKDEYDKDGKLVNKAAPNPLSANLNLNKIYIIATGNSASASELTTFCSRAIIGESSIVHIGGKTSGKYTASWTLHPYNEDIGIPVWDKTKLSPEDKNTLKNWALQPIVAIYSDRNDKTFINPGYLEPNYSLNEGFGYIDYWKPLGDPKDVLLGQALYLITGDESYKPVQPKSTRSATPEIEILDKSFAKPVVIDNLHLKLEDFNEIMRMHNLK